MFIAKVTDVITNIKTVENVQDINIFPNPATYYLTIETPQKATIDIFDIQGQLISSLTTSGNKADLNVSSLPNGIYIAKIKTENGMSIKKFIKE
jgi:hypothetical protein